MYWTTTIEDKRRSEASLGLLNLIIISVSSSYIRRMNLIIFHPKRNDRAGSYTFHGVCTWLLEARIKTEEIVI